MRTLAGTRQTLKRWRDAGIPPDRLEDVLDAVAGILPNTTKEAAPPEWAERLIRKVDSIYARQDTILERQIEMARRASRSVIEALGSPEIQAMRQEIDALRTEPPHAAERPKEDAHPPGK